MNTPAGRLSAGPAYPELGAWGARTGTLEKTEILYPQAQGCSSAYSPRHSKLQIPYEESYSWSPDTHLPSLHLAFRHLMPSCNSGQVFPITLYLPPVTPR